MTIPSPFDTVGDYMTLRRRFYGRFIATQSPFEAEIRKLLASGAKEAQQRILALDKKTTFSSGVRTAQIRMAKGEMRIVLKEIFNGTTPIITRGSKAQARTAVEALTATDRRYLEAVFQRSGEVDSYIRSQNTSAMLGVAHAISRITLSKQPLSGRVYQSRALANHWVDNIVTTSIMRGDGAKEIANAVKQHISPDTPGGVSYAAMRLGRTELNNAFHATTITLSQDRPWIESMAWNLSATHEQSHSLKPEICDIYAAQIWPVEKVPPKPHPQCRCFVTPNLEAYDVFMRHLAAGQYREWTGNQNAA